MKVFQTWHVGSIPTTRSNLTKPRIASKNMKIVVYKAQGKDWQMTRKGWPDYFYTASQKPTKFKDGRSARGFARSAQRWARENLGWVDCIFDVISWDDYKRLWINAI